MYPIRRAIVLRSLVGKHAKQLIGPDGRLATDAGVLRALLRVPSYRHGVRSMEALLLMSALAGRRHFERAALPAEAQLGMHVDAKAFLDLVAAERLPATQREELGLLLHDSYCAHRRNTELAEKLADDPSMRKWVHLDEGMRESNRLQADDIPRKLRAIDCYMAPRSTDREPYQLNGDDIERLAIMEHDRWNAERLQRQWRQGPRAPEQRTSPFLKPWGDLDEATKNYDRPRRRGDPQGPGQHRPRHLPPGPNGHHWPSVCLRDCQT
jgi:hypothetical protein